MRAIVQKQIETGLDVIDDGEQSRESFVLYMRHRLTGLGGRARARCMPISTPIRSTSANSRQRATSPDRVSNRAHLPKAIGAVALRGSRR